MLNYSANGPSGYNLTNSLRFRASASAYLSRTPASTGNRKTFTYSFWIKRGRLSTLQRFIGASDNATGDFIIAWNSSDALDIYDFNSPTTNVALTTTQVFRDPSSWYHIVIAFDTTQATAANRIKVYINGSQVTAFSSTTYPAQNANLYNNQAGILATIGIWPSGSQYFDGYMDEFNFIDGQALTPSSFGSTNPVTGVWQPAKYTGTYGTNGFYLNFTDIALTSGSNTGLGRDFSGNGNFWNTNNISVTSGVTYDAMSDVPTLTSATVANYAVLSPIDTNTASSIAGANLNWTSPGIDREIRGTIGVSSGKYYWEVVLTSGNTAHVGVDTLNTVLLNDYVGFTATSWGINLANGNKRNAGSSVSYGSAFATNDVMMCALDMDNGKIWWGNNGTWFASGDPAAGTNAAFTNLSGYLLAFAVTPRNSSSVNFGQRPFAYTPPTGFVALNTFNLPTSTIVKGNTVMDATLWTGNGSAGTITNAGGFRPDFVWWKNRNGTRNHLLFDSVRGATKFIQSNTTNAEQTDAQSLTSFNSNGFSYGTSGNGSTNGETYVGWQWQAGQGTNTTNTAGSITTTTSVNATAGFSVVTYTGNGTNGATIGHGLGVAPRWVIVKNRGSSVDDWLHYHISLGATQSIAFDNNAAITSSTRWNNTAPSSTVVTLGTSTGVNASGATYVAYCWAEIAGFSRFGSYTGNSSSDGPFVYLGFRPKFVMVKRSSSTGSWEMLDATRNTFNITQNGLRANAVDAEQTGIGPFDFLSNGFKLRGIGGVTNDAGTFIYMAFAENPFKNSLAR